MGKDDKVTKASLRSKQEALKNEINELVASHNRLQQQKAAIEQDMNKTALAINGKQAAFNEFETFLAEPEEPKKSESTTH